MPFFLLSLTVLLLFLQPASIFPEMTSWNPIRNVCLLSLLAYGFRPSQSGPSFLENETNKYFMLFVTVQLVSPMTAWLGSIQENLVTWLLYVIIYYLLVKECSCIDRVRRIVLMIVVAVGYLSYFSLSKFVFEYTPGGRAGGYGWYSNSNDLSLILVCSIPLAFLLAETSPGLGARFLFYGLAGMFVFNILFTGSRNGLLGVCLVSVLGLMFSRRLPVVLKLAVACALMLGVLTTGLSVILSRSDLHGLHGDASSEDRLVQWKAALRMVLDHPVLGVGPNEFSEVAERYQGIHGLQPHNTLIQVFAESGITGGAFFCLFSCRPLLAGWRYLRGSWGRRYGPAPTVYFYLLASLSGFWICAFFSNRYMFYILYVLVAMLVAVADQLALLPSANSATPCPEPGS